MQLPSEILTERLRLRPPMEADAENIFARYGQDALVCKYMSWTPHRSLDDTLAFLSRSTNKDSPDRIENYLIFARETGQLLGSVGGAEVGSQAVRVQFGYCLARDAWGRGYATEAAGAFVDAVMAEPTVWRIQAFCDVENIASARVLEKCGLTFEGTLRRYMVLPNLSDVPRDMLCYAKVKS